MQKKRRNIVAAIRVGGVEFLFGLIFLLLPLAFELKKQMDNSEIGVIPYYIPSICESDLQQFSFYVDTILLDVPTGFNKKEPALLVLVLKEDNSVVWIYNNAISRQYKNSELLLLKSDFRNFIVGLNSNVDLATAIVPSSKATCQNFITVLEILKEYPNPAFGQPQIAYAF